jgi:hypothetical protein
VSVDARINFGLSTVAVPPSPAGSGLALTLQAGGGAQFAAICPFNATCWPPGVMPSRANAEIIRVESVSGDELALSGRGQEGTSAQQIEPGWQFADMLTAKTIEDLKLLIEAETARAEAAETSLAGSGVAEVAVERTRAEAAEATNATAISSETARAEGAESALTTSLVGEKSAREEAVTAAEAAAVAEIQAETERAQVAEALRAPLASPALTGAPTAPTVAAKDNSTKVATTAFVGTAVGEEATARTVAVTGAIVTAEAASDAAGTAAAAVATEKARAEAAEVLKAPLASPSLTGTPTVPTASAGTNTAQAASTAFATGAIATEKTRAEAAEAEAVKLTGTQTVAGAKTFSSSPQVPEPTSATNAVSKAYVDALATGLKPHEAAKLATAAALPANSYAAGVLTASSVGVLTVDGVATKTGERILVKNEATEANNGIYVVTTEGTVSAKYALTRAADMKEASQIAAALVFIEKGAENENSSWSIVGSGPWTLGTTAIQWTVFSRAGVLVAGTGLTKTGSTLAVNYGTTAGTAAQGNDARITGAASAAELKDEKEAREVEGALKAPAASPALTGTPKAPTAPAKTNTEQLATAAFVQVAKGEAEAASDKAGAAATAQGNAEAASIPLTQKGANSGVGSLTSAGIGAQPPAHHASTHSEGGTDPLTTADLPAAVVSGSAAGASAMQVVPVENNGSAITPQRSALQVDGGVLIEDEPTNKRTRIRIANEYVWLQHHGVIAGGSPSEDQRAGFQECLNLASTQIGSGIVGTVCGESGNYYILSSTLGENSRVASPLKPTEITAGLHIPGNVLMKGPGARGEHGGMRMLFGDFGEGAYLINSKPGGDTYIFLKDIFLSTKTVQPISFQTEKSAPKVADGILAVGGVIEGVNFGASNIRYGFGALGVQMGIHQCYLLGGWSAIGHPAGFLANGDNWIKNSVIAGAFCNMYNEHAGMPINWMCDHAHFGYCAGPLFFMGNSSVGDTFVENFALWECAFEGGGRGLFVDENMNATIREVLIDSSGAMSGVGNDGQFGGVAGSSTQPRDALIKAKNVEKFNVRGQVRVFQTCGHDATNGCVIRLSGNFIESELGDITNALRVAEVYGKPFAKVEGIMTDVSAFFTDPISLRRQRVRLMNAGSAVRARDVLMKSSLATGTNYGKYQQAKQYATASKLVAGVALRSVASGEVVSAVVKNDAATSAVWANTAHLGNVFLAGTQSIPPSAVSFSTTLGAALQLGTGAALARIMTEVKLPAATIGITSLADLPVGENTVSINGQIVTYKKAEEVEGEPRLLECTGGTGTIESGTPICRAAQVESLTGASSTGGAVKFAGTTFATYTGTTETGGKKYLKGVTSSGGGEVASGATVVGQTVVKVQGAGDDIPTGPASAWNADKAAQFAYEAFLMDKSSGRFPATLQGYFIGISNSSTASLTNIGTICGGTTLTKALKSGETTAEVGSTKGFPSTGKLRLGSKEISYTAITATTFTVSGVTEEFAVGQPVTPVSGAIASEVPVRPRFGSGTENAEDKGLVAESGGPSDTKGYTFAESAASSYGGAVLLEI